MKIAIPVAQGKLCAHFGHCETFAFYEVDEETKEVKELESLNPPPHAPGVIPRWVAQQGTNIVLAGGMGGRAIQLFEMAGVSVCTGCPADDPKKLVEAYANDSLATGSNVCDHGDGDHNCGH